MRANPLFNNCKELISLFLHKGEFSYPKEITIGKKLLKLWPEMDFWRQYQIDQKFFSLSVFLTKECKKHLNQEYNLFLMFKPKEEILLEKEPVILLQKESKIKKKSRNLLEFVDEIL